METKTSDVTIITEPNPEIIIKVGKRNEYNNTSICPCCCILCILMVLVIVITGILSVMLRH